MPYLFPFVKRKNIRCAAEKNRRRVFSGGKARYTMDTNIREVSTWTTSSQQSASTPTACPF